TTAGASRSGLNRPHVRKDSVVRTSHERPDPRAAKGSRAWIIFASSAWLDPETVYPARPSPPDLSPRPIMFGTPPIAGLSSGRGYAHYTANRPTQPPPRKGNAPMAILLS